MVTGRGTPDWRAGFRLPDSRAAGQFVGCERTTRLLARALSVPGYCGSSFSGDFLRLFRGPEVVAVPRFPTPDGRAASRRTGHLHGVQPQLTSWDGTQLTARTVVAAQPVGTPEPTYGTVSLSATTETDKVNRQVTLYNVTVSNVHFRARPIRT